MHTQYRTQAVSTEPLSRTHKHPFRSRRSARSHARTDSTLVKRTSVWGLIMARNYAIIGAQTAHLPRNA